ncbi:tail protein [Escherichia coli]|nr:tail protein [Escherichia coli]
MFAKLITSRFLHIRASPEQASMEFYGGKSPKIASVHQFGLSEENRKDGKKIDYPARPLLGFTGEDVQMIEEIILAHLDPLVVPFPTPHRHIAAGMTRRHPSRYEHSRKYPGTRARTAQHDSHRPCRRNQP